jgi:poly(3-hydroxyalkanoate) depolymerase
MTQAAAFQFVTVDGLRLRVQVRGTGPPLLLIMGLGGNIEMWGPLVAALPGRQTIAYDAPGTGESAVPRSLVRPRGLARMADRLLETLGHESADVLGVSFGGGIAQELAFQSPARVRRLILAATSCGVGSMPGNPLALSVLLTPLRYYSERYLSFVAPFLYGGGARRKDVMAEQILARLHRRPSLLGYLLQLGAGAGWSSLPYLSRIRQPTLVMTGDDDPIIPLVNGRLLARVIPDARLHVVRGGGHLFLLDRIVESATVIESFLGER